MKMLKYLAVTTPFARAIQSLEAADVTVSDVLIYWLGIMSRLEYIFASDRVRLSANTVAEIRAIANQRFNEMINEGPTDIYVTALFLDPST